MGDQPKKRWKLMHKLEKIATEDSVVVPLYQFGSTRVQKPYVKGLKTPVYGPTDWISTYILKH